MTGAAPSPPPPRPLQFVLGGEVVRIEDPLPTMTVLQYLRDVAGRCGTKEGCAEGDCGACTVVLGEPDGANGVRYSAINSCIRFLPTLDGRELITVEDLAAEDGTPHPVQQAMIDLHASQCGFCTPGFVMSLFGLYLAGATPDRAQVLDALSGNLCRCTGYRPIIDAALAMHSQGTPVKWSVDDAHSLQRGQRLGELSAAAPLATRNGSYYAPRSLDALAETYLAQPDSLILAGGTDIGLWVTQALRELPPLIWIGEVSALQDCSVSGDHLRIGAAVTLREAWPALLGQYPELAEQAARFASTPIRNSATLCGNLANGSPIGDSLPALLALDAELELRQGSSTRTLRLDAFYLDYRRTALRRGEFVTAVRVPLRDSRDQVASYKVARRHDQDISAVCATFRVRLEGERVADVRLAYGGVAGTARRALSAEQTLIGKPWSGQSVALAQAALREDFQPLTDLRATGEYRSTVAAALLQRFHLATSGVAVALPDLPIDCAAACP